MGTLTLTDPVNGTTADATTIANNNAAIKTVVNGGIDNSNIASGAAIDASKLSVTYSTYSPTWTSSSGTAPALGNATVHAVYAQIGKHVHVYLEITFGSTSTYGTTGNWIFSIPVASSSSVAHQGHSFFLQGSGTQDFALGTIQMNSTTSVTPNVPLTYLGSLSAMTRTAPWTWASGDQIAFDMLYEAA